jgi:hypothetical protein
LPVAIARASLGDELSDNRQWRKIEPLFIEHHPAMQAQKNYGGLDHV